MRHFVYAICIAVSCWGCAAAQPPTGVLSSPSAASVSSRNAADASSSLHWYKGNIHTHTTNSDGDSSPVVVARWYRDHGYDFLSITDHCFQTPVKDLQSKIALENATVGKKPFLLIPGEENGAKIKTTDRRRAVHVNAIGASRTVGIQTGETVRDGLQTCIDAIRAAGGIPQVNHPNFMWSLTADDLFAAKNVPQFEIYNGHPSVHNFGGSGHPSTEEIWDDLLSRGRLYYGVADDDAHTFKVWSPNKANPGRGWVFVRATDLTVPAILDGIRRGDFYASSGVVLDDVSADAGTLALRIHQRSSFGYRTQFIGKNGAVLAVDETLTPRYSLKAGDLYVRAKVTDSGRHCAWTQPLFAAGR